MSQAAPLYVPALRMKAGELQGLGGLAREVADGTLPRMIVPPMADRDDSVQRQLFEGEECPDLAGPLATYWPGREVLVEATYLIDEFDRSSIGVWLPKALERARKAGALPVPLVRLKDALQLGLGPFVADLDRSAHLQLGLVVSSGEVGDRDNLHLAVEAMERMGIQAGGCIAIVDFHDADLSNADVVAPIISGALEDLRSAAPWKYVVFQGTNFPEKNPATDNSSVLVPRNEWLAWKKAVDFDPDTALHMLFGDYAADCAKISFGGGGAPAIRHYRYTTPDAWFVQRGAKTGSHDQVMRAVCERIVASGHFAGRGFSSADDHIYRCANGAIGPGNSTTWRAVNTTHHITRVVKDVGTVRGRTFVEGTVEPLALQQDLLSTN